MGFASSSKMSVSAAAAADSFYAASSSNAVSIRNFSNLSCISANADFISFLANAAFILASFAANQLLLLQIPPLRGQWQLFRFSLTSLCSWSKLPTL